MSLGLAFTVVLAAAAGEPLRVRTVAIEAPDAERERLSRYVDVAPGDAFEAELLRQAAAMIFATGAYEDVRVEVERTPEGVDVRVRPIPGPLLVEVKIDGPSPLGASAIQTVAGLRRGDALWPKRLETAAQAVALHLGAQGYVEALVTAEAVPAPGGAVASFKVRAGPRARVRSVDVVGDERPALRHTAAPRVGEVWRKARARESAEKMAAALRRLGYWRAAVLVEEAYDPSAAAVDLAFRVERGPRMTAAIGGEVPGGTRSAVQRLLRDSGGRSDAIDEAVDRIERALRQTGHTAARAQAREETTADETTIVFDVRPGPRVEVLRIRTEGDVPVPPVPLLTREGEPLRERELAEDTRTLTRLLRDRGYPEARVDTDVPEGVADAVVVFRVKAGTPAVVASVEVRSPVTLEAAGELRTRVGAAYRTQDVLADRLALLTSFRNAGYLTAEVKTDLRFSPDRTGVDVALVVVPGSQTRVNKIVITGLEHTREDTVRRELQLEEGDPLGLAAVLESQRRLGMLSVVGNVSISEIDPESEGRRSLLVDVEERPLTTLTVGIGAGDRDYGYLRLSGEVTRRNLGGRDRSITQFFSGSARGLRLLTTYREPYVLGHRQDLFITGFREEEERESFSFVRYGLLLETARRLSKSWSIIGRYSAQKTRTFDLKVEEEEIDRAFQTATVSGPSVSIVNDTRDDPLDPRRGRFLGGDAQLSHRTLGGESFLKGFLQGALYYRLRPRILFAGNARLGLARTFAGEVPRLPLPDRFFAGGDYSLRGFPLDRAGPLEPSKVDKAVLLPTGGNALLLGSAELRFDVARYVDVAAFTDMGNVFPLVGDIDLENLRYTAGLGIRYKSAFGPIRVDWGYKLNRREKESASRLHFTVGHAF